MRRFIFLFLVLTWTTSVCRATTFEEFKRLSREQRQELIGKANGAAYLQLAHWWLRLQVGEEGWQSGEERRLITQRDLMGLLNVSIQYKTLRQEYLVEESARRRPPMSASVQAPEHRRWKKEFDAADDQYGKDLHLLSALVPGPELEELNRRAGTVADGWRKKYFDRPGGMLITTEDTATIDKGRKEIMDEAGKLKTMTDQEVLAAINALPEDENLPRNLDIPGPRE